MKLLSIVLLITLCPLFLTLGFSQIQWVNVRMASGLVLNYGIIEEISDSSMTVQAYGQEYELSLDSVVFVELPEKHYTGTGLIIGIIAGYFSGAIVGSLIDPENSYILSAEILTVPLGVVIGGFVGGFAGASKNKSFDFSKVELETKKQILTKLVSDIPPGTPSGK